MTRSRQNSLLVACCLWLGVTGCDAAKYVGANVRAGNQSIPADSLDNNNILADDGRDECRPTDYQDYQRRPVHRQLPMADDNAPYQSDDPSQSDDPQDPVDPAVPCVDRPADHQVVIKQISYFGKACQPGTVNVTISPDLQAFTAVFNSFIAETGPAINPAASRTDCAISIEVEQAGNWSFALATADFRGFVALDEAVSAQLSSQYRFPGQSEKSVEFVEDFIGEVSESFISRTFIEDTKLVWSPCASTLLRIETAAHVNNQAAPDSFGLLAIDSLDGELVQSFGLRWKKCMN